MAQDIIIRLSEVGGSRFFTFPANPETISGTLAAKYQSFDIISKGTVKVPKGTDVTEIKWNGEFFGSAKRYESIVLTQYYMPPNLCVETLREWQESGQVLNLIVTDTWINLDVTISSFTPEVYGAYGNVKYSITFTQAKDLKIYTTDELKIAEFVKTVPRNEPDSDSDDSGGGDYSYTVVSGDTLWAIAERELGSGTDWTRIYDANEDTIEDTAQEHGKSSSDHGHWIWPGEVLTIPG